MYSKRNKSLKEALNFARRLYIGIAKRPVVPVFTDEFATFHKLDAANLIRQKLLDSEPVMISRLGSVELNCVVNYLSVRDHSRQYIRYIKGEIEPFWWTEETIRTMAINAGFFPPTIELLERFSRLMVEDMSLVDILGSWLGQETLVKKELSNAVKVSLADLEPYYHPNPWTEVLEGKKILVIHPFEESIKNQYKKRTLLFEDKRILPEFELKTLKSVQSAAGNETNFKDWFEALEHLKEKVANTDFDVAIIGCGAYGLPLAAHVKRLGRKAVHLGGATQILFGIMGKRWESNKFISGLVNEFWCKPLSSEIPVGFRKIENGCYW